MLQITRCRAFGLLFGIVASIVFDPADIFAQATRIEFKPRPGVVWIIGSVTEIDKSLPRIDLGDVHGLTPGEQVAVFRPINTYFKPLGSIGIDTTNVTWSTPQRKDRALLRIGDRVVFVRTLSQLGDVEEFRDNFLKQQLVKTGIRNDYSTLQMQEKVDALARSMARQPRWQRDQKAIAGHLRSDSVSSRDLKDMQPLFQQILRFQDYSTLRVPIDEAIGVEWDSVLQTLTPMIDEAFEERPQYASVLGKQAKSEEEIAAEKEATQQAKELREQQDAATRQKVALIHKQVDTLLYSRSQEQRRVITMLCSMLDKFRPSSEAQWYSLEMQLTQFPELKDDAQLLEDFGAVMRKVREQQ